MPTVLQATKTPELIESNRHQSWCTCGIYRATSSVLNKREYKVKKKTKTLEIFMFILNENTR